MGNEQCKKCECVDYKKQTESVEHNLTGGLIGGTTGAGIGAGAVVGGAIATDLAAGAAFGSVVPGIGTIIGGVVGIGIGVASGILVARNLDGSVCVCGHGKNFHKWCIWLECFIFVLLLFVFKTNDYCDNVI